MAGNDIQMGGIGAGLEARDGVGEAEVGGMGEGLAERGAGVALAIAERADIGMGVPIEDGDRAAGLDVAEEMAEGGFVASADDDGENAGIEEAADLRGEKELVAFQRAGERQGAENGGAREQGKECVIVWRGKREGKESFENEGGGESGARAAVIALDALVGREAEKSDAGRCGSGATPSGKIIADARRVGGGIHELLFCYRLRG